MCIWCVFRVVWYVYIRMMSVYDLAFVSASPCVLCHACKGQRATSDVGPRLPLCLRWGLSLCSSCHIHQATWDSAVPASGFILGALVYRCRQPCPALCMFWIIGFRFSCSHSFTHWAFSQSSFIFPLLLLLVSLLCIYNMWIVGMHVTVHLWQSDDNFVELGLSLHLLWVLRLPGFTF